MIRAVMMTAALAGCATDDNDTHDISPQPEPAAMAAACCRCDASPHIFEPGSISTGWPVTIATDKSGGCSSYNGQPGTVAMGSIGPNINYQSDGLHDCASVPMPSGGCPDTFTPKQKATQSSTTTD